MTKESDPYVAPLTADGPAVQPLSAGELPAVQSVLAAQSLLGIGTPAFTASSILDLMAQLDSLSDRYSQLVNPSFKGWATDIYDALAKADTSYGQKFPALYLTWQVSQFQFKPSSEVIPGPAGTGWTVVTGFNDTLDFSAFKDAKGNDAKFVATVAAGTYATGDQMATAIQTALSAIVPAPANGWAWDVYYEADKFRIDSNFSFVLLASTGANVATGIFTDIGFAAVDTSSASSHTGDSVSYGSRTLFSVLLAGNQDPSGDWNSSPNSIQVGDQQYAIGFYGRGVYPAFRNVCKINYALQLTGGKYGFGTTVLQGSSREPWVPVSAPPSWNTEITSLLQSWGEANTPKNVFPWQCTFTDFVQQHLDVLNPQSWNDMEKLKTAVTGVWQLQLSETRQLFEAKTHPTLSSEAYFYLLHLLIALCSGGDECQELAAKSLNMACSSEEYPNDTFANQLTYVALINVADPNGAFAWTASERLQLLQDLSGLVVGQDPGSSALAASLASHIKLQGADPGYPLQDPNSNKPFAERKSDTLAALDKSRQAALARAT